MQKIYNEMAEGLNGQKDDGSGVSGHSGPNGTWNSVGNNQSGNPNNSDNGNGNSDDKICRDYLRKVCNRGMRCKFIHPKDDSVVNQQQNKRDLVFCHDFQNGLCSRTSCRFIHCTVGEEDYYLSTGHVMPHILEQATMKGQILDTTQNGEAPVCKDFLMGDCLRKRGGKCRFRHLTQNEYKHEVYGTRINSQSEQHSSNDFESPPPMENGGGISHEAKRQRFEPSSQPSEFIRDSCDRDFIRPMEDIGRGDMMPREMSLRDFRDRDRELDRERDRRGLEEILLLRKQLETLKKEIAVLKKENSDLRATNDFLLEKITTLGVGKGGGTVTTVTVPTVSLASTIPVATSVRPLTAAQVSHPLSITSECSVGSVVAMPARPPQAQAPPQSLAPPTQIGVAPPPTAVLGPVGGVQVSLSQGSALNAVSLSTVTLNTMAPATSMAPSMAPSMAASIAPPPPGPAPSIAQAMSMSGASGHLVTYPIMTQPATTTSITVTYMPFSSENGSRQRGIN
ncbi:Zinc finger CCCH domain-containing protein 10 [Armadillidium vulgare]|nr:Zinc finger CCCH domain-containing protein 10 [Armadillidium vulgare]